MPTSMVVKGLRITHINFGGVEYKSGIDFELDYSNCPVFIGDYVRERRSGVNKRVTSVSPGMFHASGFRPMRASDCQLAGRYHPFHHNGVDKRHPSDKYTTPSEKETRAMREKYATQNEKGNHTMLHIAIRVPDGWGYPELVNSINHNDSAQPDGGHKTIAAANTTELKTRVTDRIRSHPDERWLLLSGNNIMEIDSPPVRCRQW